MEGKNFILVSYVAYFAGFISISNFILILPNILLFIISSSLGKKVKILVLVSIFKKAEEILESKFFSFSLISIFKPYESASFFIK